MMKITNIFLFLIFSSVIYANGIKQEILNKNILIGDIIKYQITIPINGDSISLKTDDFTPFDLVKKSQIESNKTSVKYLIELRIWEVGKQTIPEIKFSKINNKKEVEVVVPSKTIFINSTIKNLKVQDLKIKDIKPAVSIKEHNYTLLYFLIVVLLIVIIYIILRKIKIKNKKEVIVIEKKLPAHEIAYKKLSHLINLNLLNEGKEKEYVFNLSEIIREFIGNRYDFDSIELTSDELLESLKYISTFNRDYSNVISNFLEDSDMIKFSKIKVNKEDIENLTKTSFKVIDNLKIKIMD